MKYELNLSTRTDNNAVQQTVSFDKYNRKLQSEAMFFLDITIEEFCLLVAATVAMAVYVTCLYKWSSSDTFMRFLGASVAVGVLVGIGALAAIAHARYDEAFPFLFGTETRDLGLSEWGAAALFLVCSIRAISLFKFSKGIERLSFVALAIICFAIAGEEISWGQWFLHWETPEQIASVNLQNETNLHNVVDPRLYDVIYQGFGFALILTAALTLWFRQALTQSQFPLARVFGEFGHWVKVSRAGLMLTLSTGVLLQHEVFEEYAEFTLALCLALFLTFVLADRKKGVGTGISNDGAKIPDA